jgi:hypothetical protein
MAIAAANDVRRVTCAYDADCAITVLVNSSAIDSYVQFFIRAKRIAVTQYCGISCPYRCSELNDDERVEAGIMRLSVYCSRNIAQLTRLWRT